MILDLATGIIVGASTGTAPGANLGPFLLGAAVVVAGAALYVLLTFLYHLARAPWRHAQVLRKQLDRRPPPLSSSDRRTLEGLETLMGAIWYELSGKNLYPDRKRCEAYVLSLNSKLAKVVKYAAFFETAREFRTRGAMALEFWASEREPPEFVRESLQQDWELAQRELDSVLGRKGTQPSSSSPKPTS